VPVQSTDSAERAKQISQALAQVLVKVSGNTAISSLPAVASQLAHADSFVQKYSYQRELKSGIEQVFLQETSCYTVSRFFSQATDQFQ